MDKHFTPPPFKQPLAATRIYYRSPEWKFHTSVGLAKSAIGYGEGGTYFECEPYTERGYTRTRDSHARYGELWIYKDGEWVLEFWSNKERPVFLHDLPWRNNV